MSNKAINPLGKPVILYAPNYGKFAVQSATDAGAYVARTLPELEALVKSLGPK